MGNWDTRDDMVQLVFVGPDANRAYGIKGEGGIARQFAAC